MPMLLRDLSLPLPPSGRYWLYFIFLHQFSIVMFMLLVKTASLDSVDVDLPFFQFGLIFKFWYGVAVRIFYFFEVDTDWVVIHLHVERLWIAWFGEWQYFYCIIPSGTFAIRQDLSFKQKVFYFCIMNDERVYISCPTGFCGHLHTIFCLEVTSQ